MPASKQLEYRAGDFFYRDIYFGLAVFAGQEVVYHRDEAVWSMTYAGGVVGAGTIKPVFGFLRRALMAVDPATPFRGPPRFAQGDFVYGNDLEGDISRFQGRETISQLGALVYRLAYAGCRLR